MFTMEILVYLIAFFLTMVFATIRIKRYSYILIYFLFFGIYSLTIRTSGFDADINTYSNALKSTVFSVYYIKEPFFWLGSRFLFEIGRSEVFVFFIYDILVFSLFILSGFISKSPKYLPLVFMIFFPSVLGMQNVFRQFVASGFLIFLYAMVFANYGVFRRALILLLAIASHNVSALFFPLIFIKIKSNKLNLLFLSSSISILLLLPFAAGTKSASDTGDLPPYLYLALYSLIVFSYCALFRFSFEKHPLEFKQSFFVLCYMWFLIFVSIFVTGGAQSKRVGMIVLLMSVFPLCKVIQYRFKQRVFMRVLFIIILTLPTLIFNNSRSLLLST